MKRILGIDWGRNRLGVAVCDPTGTVVTPLEVVVRPRKGGSVLVELCEIVEREAVGLVVVGLPLMLDGSEGDAARLARGFGEALGERCGRVVEMYDERLTSLQASKVLLANRLLNDRVTPTRTEKSNDSVAAALMLEAFLRQRELLEQGSST